MKRREKRPWRKEKTTLFSSGKKWKKEKSYAFFFTGYSSARLERLFWEQKVIGSNPITLNISFLYQIIFFLL